MLDRSDTLLAEYHDKEWGVSGIINSRKGRRFLEFDGKHYLGYNIKNNKV